MNEKKIRDEIEYWSKHLELDKFNFDKTLSNLIGGMAILITLTIGFSSMVLSLRELDLQIRILFISIFLLIILYFGNKIKKNFNEEIKKHSLNFMVREEQLRRRYKKLGVEKKELNEEFEKIKEDYKEGKIKLPQE